MTIYKALLEFHKRKPTILKEKLNPFFKSKYSDLSVIIDSVQKDLNECGLFIVQPIILQDGFNILHTKLVHESGEMIESQMVIPNQADPQKLGSLITYFRRYSYMAILGIVSEDDDDDGNTASNKQGNNQAQIPKQNVPPTTVVYNKPDGTKLATEAQVRAIKSISKAKSIELTNIDFDTLNSREASDLIKGFNEK